MDIDSSTLWTTAGVIIATVSIFVYYKFRKAYKYFPDKNIPFIKPKFLVGSHFKVLLMQETIEDSLDSMYRQMDDEKIFGYYQFLSHVFVIKDPEEIEKILVKSFPHFQDHIGKIDIKLNPLEGHLFNLKGDNWKTLRTGLSPIFTSGKLKWMIEQVIKCGDGLVDSFQELATGDDFQYKPVLSSYGLDVIASCAFGIDIQALKNPNSKFCQMVTKIMKPGKLQMAKLLLRAFVPKFAALLKLRTVPNDVHEFFLKITRDSMEDRIQNNKKRNDFVQLLLQLKQKGFVEYDEKDQEEAEELGAKPEAPKDKKFEFTDEVLAAQSFIFFLAGLETVSVLSAYGLYLLSVHQDVQEKVREEIKVQVAAQGGVTHEALKNMSYLDLVIAETLRLFPPAVLLIRECTKTYKSESYTIEKDSVVFIPVKSLHYDKKYFEDPESFKPERFIDSKYSVTHSHGVYMPFGDGPRVCIARRFALLQAKVAFVKILENFELLESSKNVDPFKRDPASTTFQPKGGLYLKIRKIPDA